MIRANRPGRTGAVRRSTTLTVILGVLADLKKAGTTMLLGVQNAFRALRLAHRAYVLELGRIGLTGIGAELLQDSGVARAYLGAIRRSVE